MKSRTTATLILVLVLGAGVWLARRPASSPGKTAMRPQIEVAPSTSPHPQPVASRPIIVAPAEPAPPTPEVSARAQWKRCATDGECDPGLICFRGRDRGRRARGTCLAADCRDDGDCGPTASCMRAASTARCVEHGAQSEGGACELLSSAPDSRRCSAALLCVEHICARPCTMTAGRSSCPDGAACKSTENGLACAIPCDESKCAPGEHCISDHVRSYCGRRVGPSCDEVDACPGQTCGAQWDDQRHILFSECRALCLDGAACSADSACATMGVYRGECLRRCRADTDCGPLGSCAAVTSDGVRGCVRFDPGS